MTSSHAKQPRLEIFITEQKLARTVKTLARAIEKDYASKDLIVIGILKGAFVFMADLVREIDLPLQTDFVCVASYGSGTRPSGPPKFTLRPHLPLENKHLLVVEDIVDTGATTSAVMRSLQRSNPASVKLCALLEKPSRRKVQVHLDYRGIEIPDVFVVGYGLDAAEKYRNLPHIAKVEGL